MTYKEQVQRVRRAWDTKKASQERLRSWVIFSFLRPISFWFTPPFLMVGMTANQVTVWGWVSTIVIGALYAIGGSAYVPAAGIILFLNYVLDMVDGNIARVNSCRTHYGNYLDAVGDAIRLPVCAIGLAIGLYRHLAEYPLAAWIYTQGGPGALMFLAAIASFFYLLHLYLAHRLDRHAKWILLQKVRGGMLLPEESQKKERSFSGARVYLSALWHLISDIQVPVWSLLSIFNLADWLLLAITFFAICHTGTSTVVNIARARTLINFPRP